MLCLRCPRGLATVLKPASISQSTQNSAIQAPLKRTLTSFHGPSRPSLLPPSIAFRPSPSALLSTPLAPASSSSTSTSPSGCAILDLLPKISAHPALGSIQIRCGPRDTFDPSHFVRKRRHGFLSRVKTRKGRALLKRRKAKGRTTLSH
ncbi:mitochondrial 54S ribosomal protein bL34m [Drepanopeziza brunnea f. sp. 'multigermtubi']|uniref:Large ribosomal subunit protein bL34m n=1 Tax=Marssonina brunnea f. sp. multigermtubi (strain MB_m1) TaxID=1072389 RepID=K1WZX3_MARBU|nr:ribosomal protein L34 [Drepanopeziza brunnea f. sp. 'multigermtubi' MB_m1]EKD14148.1 ribosomal protein L34 [Drepanopeziza brunnea f. sp. 'multigermtubi' MB_m1]KAJ5035382.1 hypothetical protein L3040_007852 [Drepanopeziza brunnea f. sp. 'multigermtubi']